MRRCRTATTSITWWTATCTTRTAAIVTTTGRCSRRNLSSSPAAGRGRARKRLAPGPSCFRPGVNNPLTAGHPGHLTERLRDLVLGPAARLTENGDHRFDRRGLPPYNAVPRPGRGLPPAASAAL